VPQDYPDGSSSVVPSDAVELDPGFTLPWYEGFSVVVAANTTGSVTLTFNNPDFIYFVDMLGISPQVYTEFAAIIELRDLPCVCVAACGWANIPLRQNPSMAFLSGDTIKVAVTNTNATVRTFLVKFSGTKIIRPSSYGHAPGAFFACPAKITFVDTSVDFVDSSSDSPSSWEWDMKDGSPVGVVNPYTFHYHVAGIYYPRLKAINDYGYDTWVTPDPVYALNRFDLTTFTEADPGAKVTIAANSLVVTAVPQTDDAYVYKDMGAAFFGVINAVKRIHLDLLATSLSDVYVLGFSTTNTNLHTSAGHKIVVYFHNAAGVYSIQLAIMDAAVVTAFDSYTCLLNTNYYIICKRAAASTTVTLEIYSNSTFLTLVDTLTVTNAGVAEVFRYLYAFSTKHVDTAATASINDSDLAVWQ
jgi:PKD repeat protein